METATMGRVTTEAVLENLDDSIKAKRGEMAEAEVRRIVVKEALVDTGAKLVGLPPSMIERLGLEKFETRLARTATGLVPTSVYRAVWLTIQGRRCSVDVSEVHEDCPAIIGYVPLELLNFVIDPVNRRLVGDPRDDGQNILDLM